LQDVEIESRIAADAHAFGRRLLQLQMGSGRSTDALAAAAGLTEAQLEAIEDARTEEFRPGASEVRRLAAALGVALADLFERPA
jgi:transcriptional regulator with XRE-family HTH domain